MKFNDIGNKLFEKALKEMPHFYLDDKHFYDIELELFKGENIDDFITYVHTKIDNSKNIKKELIDNNIIRLWTIKRFGNSGYQKLIKDLKK